MIRMKKIFQNFFKNNTLADETVLDLLKKSFSIKKNENDTKFGWNNVVWFEYWLKDTFWKLKLL